MGRHAVSPRLPPDPNVDSTLIAFTRRPEWRELERDWPDRRDRARGLRLPPQDRCDALALAGWRGDRAAVVDALRVAGIDPEARAESPASRGLRGARANGGLT